MAERQHSLLLLPHDKKGCEVPEGCTRNLKQLKSEVNAKQPYQPFNASLNVLWNIFEEDTPQNVQFINERKPIFFCQVAPPTT